ncbi:MAG: acetyl-CoA C-acetyltransferase [Burkholderiales bacterium]|nr:MAG: acetyl-CoA C-acetyltransferase [Burkholderiales bacterium]TAG84046.1 MAG: acetyl-CoA C-acetyltransferase [Betaproteobacteria bacterium]
MASALREPIYVIDGARTPFLKAKSGPGPFTASDLAVACGRALLSRIPVKPEQFDEVILGCANPSADEVNIGRYVAMRLGCGDKVTGWTVMRNCASGMQSIDSAINNMLAGRSELVLAGGVDALSHAPLLYSPKMVLWFAGLAGAKTTGQRVGMFAKLSPKEMLSPVIALMRGLTDPKVGLLMGQTAENLAHRFGITRQEMDAFSAESHKRVLAAQKEGRMQGEVIPLIDKKGAVYAADDGVREDSTPEKLAKLKPFFDKKYGNVTAGNSSQITDGGVFVALATKAAVDKYNLPVLGKIVDTQWAGCDAAQMGLGPVYASTPILKRNNLTLNDLDNIEINEAFAAQVLACKRAWEDEKFCKEELGLDGALGSIDMNKLNVDGGAVALGHPVGASGARIVLHALNTLKRTGGKRALTSICIGGGQGGAMLLERA